MMNCKQCSSVRYVYLEIGKVNFVKNLHLFNIAVAIKLMFYEVSGIFNSFSTQRDILSFMEKSFISESFSFGSFFLLALPLNLKD